MTASANAAFLSGGFNPIRRELDIGDLVVEGVLPAGLTGTYYRIGPNPQFEPRGTYNPLLGDGMVHAFRLDGGRAAYGNRWVRTRRWRMEHEAGRALFGTSGLPSDNDASVAHLETDGVANTNLVAHGGRLLALEEGSVPFALDGPTLATLGPHSFDGALPRNLTAHPKVDPATGELLAFANFPTGRIGRDLGFYVADAAGRIVRSESLQLPFPALIHDFAVTADFVVFPACPVTVSVRRAMAGGPMIAFEPGLGTLLGVLPRTGAAEDLRWFAGLAGMAWHVMNAFDEAGRITIDVCRQAQPVFPRADGGAPDPQATTQRLTRWTLDWAGPDRFEETTLHDERCEYPRFDERRALRPYRYGYLTCHGGPGSGDPFHRGLARFDHECGQMETWAAGPGVAVGEPVFVPRAPDAPEGDGWLLASLYDEATDRGGLAVLDAMDVAAGPVAVVRLPHRMPMGFHGLWVAR